MTDPLKEALAQLRREYLLEAPGRLAELRKDVAAFKAGEPDAAQSLTRRFHRLSGSGGSYGFPVISDLSREAERWLANDAPAPTPENASRLEQTIERLADAFNAAATELGLPERPPAVSEFGWRALVIGTPGTLRDHSAHALAASGFYVRTETRVSEPRAMRLTERPDLVVVVAEHEEDDPFQAATAWYGAGAVRPRSIVMVTADEAVDRVRALAAGVDTILPADRVAVDLPKYAKTLARIGSPPPRVLLVEADSEQAGHLVSWLEQANARVTHCADGIAAREALNRDAPDLILMDTRLPGLDGIRLARLVRQDPRFGLTPIVFLTHHDTVADQIEALTAGADHFLVEPVDRELLTHLVINRAERGRRLREMVHRDGLTGLLNHATLMAELEHTVEFARRHGETFAFLMIDVDHFKRINDRYGHLAGDQVLLHVARVFQNTARASDLIGRYGGEEFGMILRRTDRPGAGVVAQKLRNALAENPATVQGGDTIPVRVCIGIAVYPEDATAASDLAQLADQALYRAKAGGRDRIEFTREFQAQPPV
ncbi:MAG TPA: diguanylate cyclase [Gemmatimonadales bacterium]|jgi:diguanylate cyclase (GGDEF)-like protein|nr:diguanylate cyclase [Gemmatimonadales bacterium]